MDVLHTTPCLGIPLLANLRICTTSGQRGSDIADYGGNGPLKVLEPLWTDTCRLTSAKGACLKSWVQTRKASKSRRKSLIESWLWFYMPILRVRRFVRKNTVSP